MGDVGQAERVDRFVAVSQDVLAPSGAKARYVANVAAIRVARELDRDQRTATAAEQTVLARYGSWGAVPDVFDEAKDNWSAERAALQELLDADEYAAARRTTINAHYTDPAIVREMWTTLEKLGFDGGTVLEPGSGAGTFIGLAPESAQMLGVELDPTTAAIARGLYPDADIRTQSFADTSLPDGFVDATIGNVPFGDVQLHDPVHNPGRRHPLHNHFIFKSLAITRPGGLVAVLTSRFTMDSADPSARRDMNKLADLVGAVRLPSGTHRRSAGTEVVTDLLVFRRREVGAPPRSHLWEMVTARLVDGEKVAVNSYYDTRPENILGDLHVGQGMYGATTLHVSSDLETVPARLREALDGVVVDAEHQSLTMTERTASVEQTREAFVPTDFELWDGTIVRVDGETFAQVVGGRRDPFKVSKKNTAELGRLLELRDGVTGLLDLEAHSTADTDEITTARAQLRAGYESYVTRFGPINRFTMTKAGARLTPEAPRIMKGDPFGPAVLALELFDDETQTSAPAALLRKRVVAPRPIKEGAETPSEAIALSLDRHGYADLETIAFLLGTDEQEARARLDTLVFDDPAQDGRIVPAAEYLSGNVREKFDQARGAADEDPDRYTANVTALEAVIPETIGSEQIEARIGAVWIDAKTHEAFFQDVLRDRSFTVENPLPGEWVVKGNRRSLLATEEYGTSSRSAPEIAAALLEQRTVEVRVEIESGDSTRRVLDAQETTAAQEKAEKLQERFGEWVWEDSERAERLTGEYNRRFNAIVLRDYTNDGQYLTLPGATESWNPRPHQRAAVARIVSEPAVGLFHQVGAGKTGEMVMGAMELRRMGLASKPAVVVPNHMLEQFSREWLQIYPQARLLAASSDDLSRDKRRLFVAKVAANDWDAVVMTREAFKKLPLSPEIEAEYVGREVEAMREALEAAKSADGDRMSIKRIEKAVARMEERQKELTELPRDPGLSFESTGIDYLFVDEAHDYKNLTTASKIPGAEIAGSQIATDLHMKLEYLRSQHGRRVATLATATPIANSVTEAYVMQRYLRPDLLEGAGIRVFDQWAATFGQTVTEMEMAPTGGQNFRMKTRFAKFQNVPEMLRLWHVFSDVKTAEDLKLPTPELVAREDGQRLPQTHVIAPGPGLEAYLERIAERAEAVANRSVMPDEDNMLWISNDGRKAALDVRMVGLDPEPVDTKLDVVASQILQIWEATRDNEYADAVSGDPSPIQGGLQLVFSDLGTPNSDGRWSAYGDLKQRLVDGGMHPDSVRFIHEAKNDSEKARLFAAARSGRISVLMGSTAKMGVGTNVQARAVALHHLDCPWRPADVEQRDGRVIRQYNQNSEVSLHRYVVERSFDSYMWQTVERKARFIAQIMRGKLDVREIEDIGQQALSAAETKAIASGNPLLLEQAQTADELAKLERLERAHRRSQSNLVQTRSIAQARSGVLTERIGDLETAVPSIVDTTGDQFHMRIGGEYLTKRADAGAALATWARHNNVTYLQRSTELREVGSIGSFAIDARMIASLGQADVEFTLRGLPDVTTRVSRERTLEAGVGLVQRLENLQASVPRVLADSRHRFNDTQTTLSDAAARIGMEFTHTERLQELRIRAEEIRAEMTRQATESDRPPSAPEDIVGLAAAVREDAWWDGRNPHEVKDLLDSSRSAAEDSAEHANLYRTLATEVRSRSRSPEPEKQRARSAPEDTGPVTETGGTNRSGPSF